MPSKIIPIVLDETSPIAAPSFPTAKKKGYSRQSDVVWQGANWGEGTPTDDGQYIGYLLHTVTYHHT